MKNPNFRPNRDLIIISEVHLGSDHCLKQELLEYFKTIHPQKLVFIGEFIEDEYWETLLGDTFCLRIFKVLRDWINEGVQVYFMGKTRPEILAVLLKADVSKFICKSKLEFRIDHKTFLITGQETLRSENLTLPGIHKNLKFSFRVFNVMADKISGFFRSKRYEIGKLGIGANGKLNLLSNYFNRIERNCVHHALKNNLDGIITGLMSEPKVKIHDVHDRKICFFNTGEWNISLSALEYVNSKWELHIHDEHFFAFSLPRLEVV